jgi:V8-like Glu-specific endopeptidase
MTALTADDRVSNSDLATDEIEEAASFEGGGEHIEPGPGGLEAIGTDLTSTGTAMIGELAPVAPTPSMAGLRPAVEASYDVAAASVAFRAESVIEEDDRRRVTNTDAYPWRVHASLRITARDGSRWIGTAFFIAPRVLATAGHNLFFHGPVGARRGWARTIEVMPGRDGDELPFGTAMSTSFHSVRGWTEPEDPGGRPDPDYDYGVIVLDVDEAYDDQHPGDPVDRHTAKRLSLRCDRIRSEDELRDARW